MRFFNLIKYYLSLLIFAVLPVTTTAADIYEPLDESEFDIFLSAVEQTRINEESLCRERLAKQIIDYAGSFLGRPYRRGAKGPKAFDCSGFTSYVFRQFDHLLAASSRTQYHQGEAVDTKNIQPGDLLFFSGRKAGKTVGHVGIAIDVDESGNISFIHAAHNGGIRIDKVRDGGYYSKRYIGARRVI